MLSNRVGWVMVGLLLLGITGCGGGTDDEQNTISVAPTSVGCGSLTCGGAETCLVSQSLRPFSEGPRSYSCIATPPGCGGLELCDCPASQGSIEGKPVTGCSILGERSLYVTDVTCGDRNCTADEYCLAKHAGSGAVTPVLSRVCRTLPSACGVDMCSADCKAQVATTEGLEVIGCLKSDFARAIDAY